MFLKCLKSIETFVGVLDGGFSGEYVWIEAILSCPVCGMEQIVKSKNYSAPYAAQYIESALRYILEDFVSQRPCVKCGVVSRVPELDRNALYSELLDGLPEAIKNFLVVKN